MAEMERVILPESETEAPPQEDSPPAVSAALGDQTDPASGEATTEKTIQRDTLDAMEPQIVEQPIAEPEPEILCPRVNCPEKILFCLDYSSEMNETYFRSRVGDKLSAQSETIKALRMFVMNKNQINPNHQFGLAIFHDCTVWVKEFTSKPREFLAAFDDLHEAQRPAANFDLTNLFEMIQSEVQLPTVDGDIRVIPPPYIVRIIVIYGRSYSEPYFTNPQLHHELESSPYFFVDVLYVHEQPSEENKCEEIFNRLCELDHKGMSYILEAANLTRLFDSMAKLLAHPLQRPVQRQADYHLASTPPIEPQAALG